MMKKILILLYFTFCTFFYSMSQNGGIINENNVLRIEYFAYTSGKHVFKVTNKVACETWVQVQKSPTVIVNYLLTASNFILVEVEGPQTPSVQVKARRVSGETCTFNPDAGWVETTSLLVLPVTFHTRYGYCFYPDKTIDFQFTVEETTDVKQYYIKYSTDGKTFRYIQTVTPNKLLGTQTYKVKLK